MERKLPEGLLVDTSWFKRHGYSRQLLHHYVATGWLEQPARGIYRRRRGSLTWQQAVISLQMLLGYPLVVGGRTAIELQGYGHYLSHAQKEVHLYGPKPPPGWLHKLRLDVRFVHHNSKTLFRTETTPVMSGDFERSTNTAKDPSTASDLGSFTVQPWGQWNWPIVLSSSERAVLELLDELPRRESFHQVDKLMEGMANLSPRRLQPLLSDCSNVKVKRLFFFFATRHQHAWLTHLNKDQVDFGKGKRMLVKGGKLDRTYQITVPEDLDGV